MKRINEEYQRLTPNQILAKASPEVKKFLSTPLSRLDKRYLNLLPPYQQGAANFYSIMDFMKLYETMGGKNHISFTGDEPTGWIVYRAEGDEIAEFDICSFIEGPNPVLLRDARTLFEKLMKEYEVIRFQSLPGNPFKKAYDKIVKFYGGVSWEEDGMVWYEINKLEEEVSAASFAGNVPENCREVISFVGEDSMEQLANLKGENVDDL